TVIAGMAGRYMSVASGPSATSAAITTVAAAESFLSTAAVGVEKVGSCSTTDQERSRCRSLPAGDCVGVHGGAGEESPAGRLLPQCRRPRLAAKRSRCRSLPAGDRIGGHGAGRNRRQGRLLQCPG